MREPTASDSAEDLSPDVSSPPEVSVIIATHNRRSLLAECLESLGRQESVGFEAIVVDDCSSDDTWSWLGSRDEPWLIPHRLDEPSERSVARNTGAAMARGRWVLFLDDDDLLTSRALTSLLSAATSVPGTIGAVGTYRVFGQGDSDRPERWPRRQMRLDMFLANVSEPIVSVNRSLFAREAFRQAGGFDAGLNEHEDFAFGLRLTAQGPFMVIPDVVLRHRVHGGQTPRQAADIRGPLLKGMSALPPARKTAALARWETQQRQAAAADTPAKSRLGPALRAATWMATHDRAVVSSPFSRYHLMGGTAKLLLTGLLRRDL